MTSSQQPDARPHGFLTPARLTFTFIVLALVAAFGASSCNPPTEVAKTDGGAANANTNVTVTTSAPANNGAPPPAAPTGPVPLPTSIRDAELKTLDGKKFKLSDYAGKVVLINLWATWCGPCRIETPELDRLSKEYKGRGVQFIGLTSPGNDPDPEQVKNFVREMQVSYTIGYAEDQFVATLMQGRNVIPQSFIITRDGRVIKRFVGFNPTITPQQLRETLNEAVNG
jgi:thiol-disulfide isomerase/thioredoxin